MQIDLTAYLRSELFVLVPVLYVVGMLLKRSPMRDWLIPFVLCGAGVGVCFVYFWGEGAGLLQALYASMTQGVLCAACSVCANNLVKQFSKRNDDDKRIMSTDEDSKSGENAP